MDTPLDDSAALVPVADESYLECEQGKCIERVRQVMSNLSATEHSRRLKQHPTRGRAASGKTAADAHSLEAIAEDVEETSATVEKLHELLASEGPDAMVAVIVKYDAPAFDYRLLRKNKGGPSGDRVDLIDDRAAGLQAARRALELHATKSNGKVTYASPLRPHLELELSVDDAIELAGREDVQRLSIVREAAPEMDADFGQDRRKSSGLPADAFRSVRWDGETGGRNGGTVLLGIIEAPGDGYFNGVNVPHAAFLDYNGGSSRIREAYDCSRKGTVRRCRAGQGWNTTRWEGTHGTEVAGIAMGSVEQGQDSAITDLTARQNYSGIATEAEAYYLRTNSNQDVSNAIDKAVELGVDIINMSMSPGNYSNCKNDSIDGARGAIEAATDAGVLVVTAAGNDGWLFGGCTVNSYGTYPDSLAAGGIDLGLNGSLGDLSSVPPALFSARGSFDSEDHRGNLMRPVLVDLLAAGWAGGYPTSYDTYGQNYATWRSGGTSISAPVISGIAAIFLDWAVTRGGLPGGLTRDPYAWRALLSVMGDSFGWRDRTAAAGGSYAVASYGSPDETTGFGKLRFVNLDDMGGAWGVQRRVLVPGQVVEWSIGGSGPESTSVLGWKSVALIDRNRYAGTPKLYFTLVDRCTASGTAQALFGWSNYGMKARFAYAASWLAGWFHNRCMWQRVELASDSPESVELYTADYYYTNSRVNHQYQ